MNQSEQIEYLKALEAATEANKQSRLLRQYQSMYDWQHRFNAATKENRACLLMAANQVGKCVTKQTLIDLADGTQKTAGELYEEGNSFKVMSWDGARIVEAWATDLIKKPEEPCVRINLSNNTSFECALDHRILTEDGYVFVRQRIK